jgi:hypothetical protein
VRHARETASASRASGLAGAYTYPAGERLPYGQSQMDPTCLRGVGECVYVLACETAMVLLRTQRRYASEPAAIGTATICGVCHV